MQIITIKDTLCKPIKQAGPPFANSSIVEVKVDKLNHRRTTICKSTVQRLQMDLPLFRSISIGANSIYFCKSLFNVPAEVSSQTRSKFWSESSSTSIFCVVSAALCSIQFVMMAQVMRALGAREPSLLSNGIQKSHMLGHLL